MARVSHPERRRDLRLRRRTTAAPISSWSIVEGGDLRRQIVPDRPMDPARVRPLIGPIARALAVPASQRHPPPRPEARRTS